MRGSKLMMAPLGKKSTYISQYKPELLFPILREDSRKKIGIDQELPFQGYDFWNAFELSWLNAKGKPVSVVAEFIIPCDSPFLIESKSFKLYLNSFNNSTFATQSMVEDLLRKDLSNALQKEIGIKFISLTKSPLNILRQFDGVSLDHLDISCDTYHVSPRFLRTENGFVTETLHSDLLKSNCLVTGQPDWGSIQIAYTGQKINHEGLLQYIVSFRNHDEFGEHCAERMFMDIRRECRPEKLSVYTRYTRRGGLDINSYRTNAKSSICENVRLYRQ